MTNRKAASFAVRASVIDKLNTLVELRTITGGENRVWDYVDADAQLPYLAVLIDDDADWSFSLSAGDELIFTVHAYSGAKGSAEAEQMLQIVKESLHDAILDISLEGHRMVNLRFQTGNVGRDFDAQSYHGFARYRVTTEEI